MMKYVVNLTNPEDLKNSGPSSFGTGEYGFVVYAEGMAEAKTKAIARAKRDGFYGCDWSACITRLDQHGQKDGGETLSDIFSEERSSVIDLQEEGMK